MWKVPSRVGVYWEPKRTSIAEVIRPSTIQARVWVRLLMQITLPFMQRRSTVPIGLAVGGWSCVRDGRWVRARRALQVAGCTVPVRGRPRCPWKARTAAVVTGP